MFSDVVDCPLQNCIVHEFLSNDFQVLHVHSKSNNSAGSIDFYNLLASSALIIGYYFIHPMISISIEFLL